MTPDLAAMLKDARERADPCYYFIVRLLDADSEHVEIRVSKAGKLLDEVTSIRPDVFLRTITPPAPPGDGEAVAKKFVERFVRFQAAGPAERELIRILADRDAARRPSGEEVEAAKRFSNRDKLTDKEVQDYECSGQDDDIEMSVACVLRLAAEAPPATEDAK